MVFWLPPLLAAACQQLAEQEAAGPCLQKAFYFKRLGGVETPPPFSALCTIWLTKWLSSEPKRLPDNLRKLSLTRSCLHLKNSGTFRVFCISLSLGFVLAGFLLCNDSLGSGWLSQKRGLFCIRWGLSWSWGGRCGGLQVRGIHCVTSATGVVALMGGTFARDPTLCLTGTAVAAIELGIQNSNCVSRMSLSYRLFFFFCQTHGVYSSFKTVIVAVHMNDSASLSA